MASIIEIPDKPRKRTRPVLTAEDLRRITWFRAKLPEWRADRLTLYTDLGAYGPEALNLIRKIMMASGVNSSAMCKRIGAHQTYASRLFGTLYDDHVDNLGRCSPKVITIERMFDALVPEVAAAARQGPRPLVVAAPRTFGAARK
jgi:hypothetical protein